MSNEAKPENYDKPWPLSYGAPVHKELNAQFPNGQGVNKSAWPTSNELANKVYGTKATVIGKEAGLHPTFGGFDKTETIHSKVASDSVKESSKHRI